MVDTNNKTFDTGGILKVGNLNTDTQVLRDLQKKEDTAEEPLQPFSPAATNLPVVLVDENGERIGNVWSPKQGGLGTAIANIERGKATTLYFDTKSNTFANYPISTMSYKDGKININVADDVKKSEWYKNLIGSESFKNLAVAYANDPTGETKLEITEKDAAGEDTKKEKTINDLLGEYKEQLEKASKQYQGNIDTRTNISKFTNGALNLTDEDIDMMSTYRFFSKDKFSETDVVPLFDGIEAYFKDYDSYDPVSKTISAKDFYEKFYNLNEDVSGGLQKAIDELGDKVLGDTKEASKQQFESQKDYAIDLIRLKAEQTMVDLVGQSTFDKDIMTPEDKAYASSQYARAFAVYQMMNQDTPSSDSWSGFNMSVQGLSLGIAHGAGIAGENITHFWSQVSYTAVDAGVRAAAAINTPFSWLHELFDNFFTGGIEKMVTNTRSMYEHFDEWYEQNSDENSVLGEMRESISELGKTIDNREDLATAIFGQAESDLAKTYANTEVMVRIGNLVGYSLTQILATNPIGEAVGGFVGKTVADAASTVITGYRLQALTNMAEYFAIAASTANNASTAVQYMKLLNEFKAIGGAVGWTANMLAQGVVDTFIENPSLTDALLFGEKDVSVSEFQRLIRNNINWNIVGEVAPGIVKGSAKYGGKSAAKLAKAIEKTKPGAVAQAILRKNINWFTVKGRKLYEGISEFMTRKSKENIIEEGSDIPFSGKLNPEKRWQNLRKQIIDIQEQIKDIKLRDGESWSEQAKKIDDLVQTRIELETVLGMSKKLAVARGKETIIKNAGLQIENSELSEYTASLTRLSKKMGQTNVPGSFSLQTGDYISDLFNKQLLTNKEAFLKANGKALSEAEQKGLNTLINRITKYETGLPIEYAESYKQLVSSYMESNYRYYYKLNNYLSSDAGGNIIPRSKLEGMRANNQYGPAGEMYMPLLARGGYKGAEDVEEFLKDPSRIVREGGVDVQVETFSRKRFSEDVTYIDPNFTRDIITNAYAQVTNAANMTDAIVRTGRTTSVPTDSQGNILKTPEAVEKAKKNLYKDLETKFEQVFKENRRSLGPKTIESTKAKATAYYKQIQARSQRTVNDLLGLDQKGLKTYASTMNAAEISQVGKVYALPDYSRTISSWDDLKTMYDSLSPAQQKIVKKTVLGFDMEATAEAREVLGVEKDMIGRWNDAVTNNSLDTLLSRQYIADNKGIYNSKFYKDMVATARATELEGDEALALRTAQAELDAAAQGLKTGDLKGTEAAELNAKKARDFNRLVKNSLSDAVDGTAASLMDNTYLEQLIKEYEKEGISSDLAKEYLVYQWLYDNRGAGGVLQDIAFRYYNAPSKVSEIKISTDAAKNYSKKFQKAADSIIESKLNKLVKTIQEQGTEGLINLESTAKRVDEYFKDITDAWGRKEIVEAWDREKGQFKYYKVDHSTYTLVTNYPTFKKNNLLARTLARINALARIGQITIRSASLITQGFKDTFDAMVLGGWDELILDNPSGYKKIAQYIGPEVVDAFSKEMTPSAWKQFLADAEWNGLTVEEAIAKAETNDLLLKTRIKAGPGTSTSYFSYRNLYDDIDQASVGAEAQIQASKDAWNGAVKKQWQESYDKARVTLYKINQARRAGVNRLEDGVNILHNAREEFLRKQVYRQNFMDALDAGKSIAQARSYAQYFMENATTNFSRGFAWGSNIVRSIPYFGAMLNGASSMVRLLEVDPLGIMTRFVADLVLPVVGLTVMSLEDPANAEIYKNIPEYEKEGNIHWVVDGRVYTVPLPEELAKFVLPFRHAVEQMHDANSNAWHELLLNDLLNMPTIPLNAVMMLDDKKINADPSVMDRISALGMSMFNTLAPNAARTLYIARTGKDPYTGENYGRQKWYLDENGEYQLMSVSEYGFANDMADVFKGWGWEVNPIMAEAMFSSLFGTGSLDLAEGIRDFVVTVREGAPDITALISPSMERAGKVLTGTTRTDKQQAQIAWYSLYYDIQEKKNELLAPNGKLARYAQDIDTAKSQDVLDKRVEAYNAEVRNWQNSVMEEVKQYTNQYGDYFDRSKFAATLSMMTAQLSIDNVRNSDQYYNSRALAVETMIDAGFNSPSDSSIFGYVYRDKDSGKVSIRYTDPLIISLTENTFWYQGDEAVQMVEDTIELSGLKEKYNQEIYPAYSKYMNEKDYDKANDLSVRWDVELMRAIKPIIDEYTVGELLRKSTAIDLLDNYILVPSTTEAMGKGKYYSSSTGLNKRRGYAQSYVKKIYDALNKKEKE